MAAAEAAPLTTVAGHVCAPSHAACAARSPPPVPAPCACPLCAPRYGLAGEVPFASLLAAVGGHGETALGWITAEGALHLGPAGAWRLRLQEGDRVVVLEA